MWKERRNGEKFGRTSNEPIQEASNFWATTGGLDGAYFTESNLPTIDRADRVAKFEKDAMLKRSRFKEFNLPIINLNSKIFVNLNIKDKIIFYNKNLRQFTKNKKKNLLINYEQFIKSSKNSGYKPLAKINV